MTFDAYPDKVKTLAEELQTLTHTQVLGLEDVVRQLPSMLSESEDNASGDTGGDEALYKLLAMNDVRVAMVNAGFAPPDSAEHRMLLIQGFLDAVQKASILPYAIEAEIAESRVRRLEAEVREVEATTQKDIAKVRSNYAIESTNIQETRALDLEKTKSAESEADNAGRAVEAALRLSKADAKSAMIPRRQALDARIQERIMRRQEFFTAITPTWYLARRDKSS
jgi:hypothetical protein